MIQRIQTLYLLAIVALGIALCFAESCADTMKTIKEYPGECPEVIQLENQ